MKKIVYLPGVWDIIHSGHLNIIKRAKLLGDYLIVGVCSDRLVSLHKQHQVALSELERANVISALKWVDEVFVYDDPDQSKALNLFKANVFVVGEDFGKQGVPEHEKAIEFCNGRNIPIVVIPRMPGISSSNVKERVRNNTKSEIIKDFWKKRAEQAKIGKIDPWQATSLTVSEEAAEKRREQDVKYIFEAIHRICEPLSSALEIGCGTGRITRELAPIFSSVDAIDYEQDFVDVAKEQLKGFSNVKVYCDNALNFDKSSKYQCCVIAGLFNYLVDDEFEELIRQISHIPYVVLKESVGTFQTYELDDSHFSEEMNSTYTAKYRSVTELINSFAENGFSLRYTDVVEEHRKETHLRVFLFKSGLNN